MENTAEQETRRNWNGREIEKSAQLTVIDEHDERGFRWRDDTRAIAVEISKRNDRPGVLIWGTGLLWRRCGRQTWFQRYARQTWPLMLIIFFATNHTAHISHVDWNWKWTYEALQLLWTWTGSACCWPNRLGQTAKLPQHCAAAVVQRTMELPGRRLSRTKATNEWSSATRTIHNNPQNKLHWFPVSVRRTTLT